MAYKKEALGIHLEAQQMLELKRALFSNGLTAHQFFGYLVSQLNVNDTRLIELLKEAQEYKRQRILDGKEENVDAESLYRLIEDELNSKKE